MNLRSILPAAVSVAEGLIGDLPTTVLPAEEHLVQRAVTKRRRAFSAGRGCARAALASLGLPGAQDIAIMSGPRRQPLWPSGVVGSITHSEAYCASAVAWESQLAGLGIDAELNTPLDDDLAEFVLSSSERRWCRFAPPAHVYSEKLLFSIKESIFKLFYPLVAIELGFQDAEVSVDLDCHSFHVEASSTQLSPIVGLLDAVDGSFAVGVGHVLTAAWIERR